MGSPGREQREQNIPRFDEGQAVPFVRAWLGNTGSLEGGLVLWKFQQPGATAHFSHCPCLPVLLSWVSSVPRAFMDACMGPSR